ncbi:hypothetical protein EDC01DRAFT_786678 [Geopyxis carbonaria]|nr:hypothetical protein EDC01DRAFT_786678 [Geopyxis carbonaria]
MLGMLSWRRNGVVFVCASRETDNLRPPRPPRPPPPLLSYSHLAPDSLFAPTTNDGENIATIPTAKYRDHTATQNMATRTPLTTRASTAAPPLYIILEILLLFAIVVLPRFMDVFVAALEGTLVVVASLAMLAGLSGLGLGWGLGWLGTSEKPPNVDLEKELKVVEKDIRAVTEVGL